MSSWRRQAQLSTYGLAFLVSVLAVVLVGLLARSRVRGGGESEVHGSDVALVEVSESGASEKAVAEDVGIAGANAGAVSENLESADDLSSSETYQVSADLPTAAKEVVENYLHMDAAVLARAGYLDLAGRVWSCTVIGPGWVDTCLVSEESTDLSKVSILRMEASRWEDLDVLQANAN